MSVQEAQQHAAKRLQGDTSNRECSRLERLFLDSYIMVGLNGAEAARSIKRGGKFPDRWASLVLKRPWVRAELDRRLARHNQASEATIEALREHYRQLAYREFEGPWLASHKLQAMDRLGNSIGMFRPDIAIQVPVTFSFIGSPRHHDLPTIPEAAPQRDTDAPRPLLLPPEADTPEKG